MSKQWFAVAAIVGGLAVGSAALVRLGSGIDRVEVGARMPDFKLEDARSGDSLSLRKEYQGSVTLVNIWATWCGPCRVEMPSMQKAYESYRDQGFRIAAVSVDQDGRGVVTDFANEMGITFDLLQDRTRRIEKLFQTTGVPESYLVNRDGIIVKWVIGAHDWDSPVNRALIERLLSEGPGASPGPAPAPATVPGRDSAVQTELKS